MSIRWDCEKDGCYKDKCVPDWGWLNGLLPRGCRPTDIDGIVELDGRFLLLELKAFTGTLQNAQKWVFERLTALTPDIIVVVLYAETMVPESLREMQLIYNGKSHPKIACTHTEFASRYARWGKDERVAPPSAPAEPESTEAEDEAAWEFGGAI